MEIGSTRIINCLLEAVCFRLASQKLVVNWSTRFSLI